MHEFREVVAVAYSKNKRIGRPPVFESKEELEKKIEEFFKSQLTASPFLGLQGRRKMNRFISGKGRHL